MNIYLDAKVQRQEKGSHLGVGIREDEDGNSGDEEGNESLASGVRLLRFKAQP